MMVMHIINKLICYHYFGGADCKPGDFKKLVAKEAGVKLKGDYLGM